MDGKHGDDGGGGDGEDEDYSNYDDDSKTGGSGVDNEDFYDIIKFECQIYKYCF